MWFARKEIAVNVASSEVYLAEVVGEDPETDLAVLRVSVSGLSVAHLGDSNRLKTGQVMIANGNPLELQSTVTRRDDKCPGTLSSNPYENVIQKDAAAVTLEAVVVLWWTLGASW